VQPLVDGAPDGGTVVLTPGRWQGPIVCTDGRRLTIKAAEGQIAHWTDGVCEVRPDPDPRRTWDETHTPGAASSNTQENPLTVEMFQPVVCNEQTGDFVPLEAPTLDRAAAEEQAAGFDAHAALIAQMSQAPPVARGAVLEGYFIAYRIVFADGSVEELQQPRETTFEQESANGHGAVEAPELPAEVVTPTRVAVTG